MGTSMFLLNFGEVEVVVGEEKKVVAQLHSGALFGEMATISKNPAAAKRTATIRAKNVCHCWRIDRPSLSKILSVFPKDEVVLSAEADRRLEELREKGHLPKNRERSWSIFESKPLDLEDPLNVSRNKVHSFHRRMSKSSESLGRRMSMSRRMSSSSDNLPFGLLSPQADEPTALEQLPESNYSSEQNGELGDSAVGLPSVTELPTRPSLPARHVKLQIPQENLATWAIGESSELKQVRDSARDFLAKREAHPIVQRRFTRRKCRQTGNPRRFLYFPQRQVKSA